MAKVSVILGNIQRLVNLALSVVNDSSKRQGQRDLFEGIADTAILCKHLASKIGFGDESELPADKDWLLNVMRNRDANLGTWKIDVNYPDHVELTVPNKFGKDVTMYLDKKAMPQRWEVLHFLNYNLKG